MKKLLLTLTLLSAPLCPAQDFNQAYEFLDNENELDWNDKKAIDELLQKIIVHYEKYHQKAITHQLFEDEYISDRDRGYIEYFDITVLSALEKFGFDYLKQNPHALEQYTNALFTLRFLAADDAAEDQNDLWQRGHEVGIIINEHQLEFLSIFPLAAYFCNICSTPELENSNNLFRNIAEYAARQIKD